MAVVDLREAVIRVVVPPRPDVLHLLRSVAASVGARMSMPLDDVEELRIAVDEAATLLLERGADRPEGPLEMELTCTDERLRARLRLGAAMPAEDVRSSWPWRVISGVVEDASIEPTDSETTITFSKTAPGTGR